MSDIEIDYDFLTQKALRNVITDVLEITSDLGEAPGEHHFYIEFLTHGEGVSIPDHLIEQYPERMTIVLQHQFENLTVANNVISVSLSFKGKPAALVIPLDAVTSFYDPSVEFGLRFEAEGPDQKADTPEKTTGVSTDHSETPKGDDASPAADEGAKTNESADVVSLDSFRKK